MSNDYYKRTEWKRIVADAAKGIHGDSPLTGDASIIWADERISELEAKLAEREWISVEDRLPDTCGMFLVLYGYGETAILFLNSDKKWCMGNSFYPGITHWQRLPPQPKEK